MSAARRMRRSVMAWRGSKNVRCWARSGGGGRPRCPSQVATTSSRSTAHLDATAHEARVDRVVVREHAHVVVPGQPDAEARRGVGHDGRERAHRPSVLEEGSAGTSRVVAWVRLFARPSQVVSWSLKSSASWKRRPGEKGRLVVAVGPLVGALGLGIVACTGARRRRACPGSAGSRR